MGQLIRDNVLASTIFRGHQPIGLYSHRGHAAIVLAITSLLCLIAWKQRWRSSRCTLATLILLFTALLFTQTRAAILALVIAVAYLITRFGLTKQFRRIIIGAGLACLLFVGAISTHRDIGALKQFNFASGTQIIKNLTSDRIWLWELSLRGITQRPLIGWGFNGFGIAYPYVITQNHTLDVIRLGNLSYDYRTKDEQLFTTSLPTYKAHNLILDTLLSVGVLGMLAYFALFGFYFWWVSRSPHRGIEAVAIAYLVFTVAWFECAQFTHLVWWVLSLGGVGSHTVLAQQINLQMQQISDTGRLAPDRESVGAATTVEKTAPKPMNISPWGFTLLLLAGGMYSLFPITSYPLTSFEGIESLFTPQGSLVCGSPSSGPTDNLIHTRYGSDAYTWTDEIRWRCVYNINDFKGRTDLERFNRARDAAAKRGGGVVYFPAGIYRFSDSLYLKNGVVLRGETPADPDAKASTYRPLSQLLFPKYEPSQSGNGTPNQTAFKKIRTTSPNTDRSIGLVNLDINRAGIYLLSDTGQGRNQNIVVYGVRSNNVADPINNVPDLNFQSPWLRYSDSFAANIGITAYANVLVSNNRLNDAVTDNYDQPNYQIASLVDGSVITLSEGWKASFNPNISQILKKGESQKQRNLYLAKTSTVSNDDFP